MAGGSVRLDPRAVLSIAVLAIIILVIIFVELCGREDIDSLVQQPQPDSATATLGPTFTPGPSPTVGPTVPTVSPTPMPGGRDRDAIRVEDLQSLQFALQAYFADHDEFPSNEGTIQTLCVFTEFDVGCGLLEILDELPSDPAGDASTSGYWYVSDGSAYTLYGQRESDSFPECLERPEFLVDIESLLCFSGP